MDIHKVSYLALLLLFGMISHVEHADAKPCFKNCDPRLAYEICPRPEISNKVDSNRICVNCCSGKKGCSYFGPDGSFICKGESDPEHPKACPLNCDPRIVSGICPLSKNKKPKVDFNRLCINCCSGKKGCSYFGEDGSFICKGESDPENPKACPLNCDPRIVSGICPLSENKKPKVDFNRLCINCCSGKKGCSYFGEDGSFICKGESDPENPKACPLYCDLRIVTGICPVSENKKPKVERLCTNCCAGKKGCYYYNADREFICEGESEYDSHKIMSVVS